MTMTVDEFVQTKVLPEFRPVVELIRLDMRELAPNAQELVAYGIPCYKARKIFAVISPTKKDITLSFTHGILFEDKYALLRGVSKLARHIKYKKVADVNKDIIEYYVKQALALDSAR
jgi:uncharacterized protein YdhG (YjbR/CyaY superfamily)